MSAPGIGWITGFTIASEIGEITRFSSPVKLTGYTAVPMREPVRRDRPPRPLVQAQTQVSPLGVDGGLDRRVLAPALQGALPAHQAPLGRQRGAKVAQIELARKLTEAIWYMLTRNQPFKPFAPAGAIFALTA